MVERTQEKENPLPAAQIDRRRLLASATGIALGSAAGLPRVVTARAQGATASEAANEATIVVIGNGKASVPATGAILQLIIRSSFNPNFAINASRSVAVSAINTSNGSSQGPTAEDLEPILKALVSGGVPERMIDVVALPPGPYAELFGSGSASIAAELDIDSVMDAQALVDAAVAAGDEAGFAFDPINLIYLSSDCETAQANALAEAVANGKAHAEALAIALGVNLGTLVSAVQQATYNPYSAYGAGFQSGCEEQITLENAALAYLPAFNPMIDPELHVAVQIYMTYGVA